MDFSSFLTSLGTSFLIFLVLMFLFTWLSRNPANKEIYYPNRILRGLDPLETGSKSRNPFTWIREALSSTEQDVINISGVDTAVYFVFLTTVFGILVLSGIVLLPVLLPVAATSKATKVGNATSKGAFNDLDKLAIGQIEKGSRRLWFYLGATYWVSFVSYYLLWKAYNRISSLRATALSSSDVKAEQFAVLVRDIPTPPEGQTRKQQVDSYFKAIYPDTFYRSLVVTDNKQLKLLLWFAVFTLPIVICCLKSGLLSHTRIGYFCSYTKVNKISTELEGYKKKLAHAEAVYEESKKKTGKPEGVRPTNKLGFLGLLGKKVDTIEHCNEKINELIPLLDAEQKVTLRDKQQAAAIVFFTSRLTAAAASQSLHDRKVDHWTVVDAPEPRQVIWSNLHRRFYERQTRSIVVYVIVALTILFYTIPIGLISAFTTLKNLEKLLPFLKPVVNIAAIKTVLEAYLPQIALILFLALLPKFLLFLSKAEGIPSKSHAFRAASGKYYYFTVFNVFLGVTISGTLFDSFKDIEKNPNSVVPILARSLPANATFFLTFVALKFFVGYGLELSRLVPLIVFRLKKKYLCKTEAELKEAWTPGDLGYSTRIPNDMLVVTIVLCYCTIAPIIIPFGVLYFGLGWLVLRNQALKVYVPSYESYGRIWPHIFNRVLASLILFQVLMFGFLGGVMRFPYTVLLIFLPSTSLVFGLVCSNKFYRFFQFTALEVACHELKEPLDVDAVFRSYVVASLIADKLDEEEQVHGALSLFTTLG